ncbi:hypothetical protein [Amycolatopsis magusensis]
MKILCPLPTLFRLCAWLTAFGVVLGVAMAGEPASVPVEPTAVHRAR